ncbi:hypothetical protein SAMN05443287_112151 [Micromonospora phaseoli]|uniref:Uncharacterized protein n=1 Tax=Micromonospora phaseoli TaxID=1144548 RepID=A0A1H7DAE5_9ACTN|nr:hypothetical protein [Micromonospora phaseoli]PZV90929.1 hypothetical protein CLV64_112152 [Micromonospora phaseoli]GIJ77400.1 hypothetical protein Xph01_18320 [Micromonospora phaseoli]SEJ98676.1 hypothetical protein SAMN05443287_112151 [Micromonospora phaseoli]
MSDESRAGGMLDGFHIGQVPDGVGDEVSDFASEWDDVRFASRVWERQVPDGHRADLRVHVLRGDRLADLTALRDFLCAYHERDPVEWRLEEFQHGDGPGLTDGGQAFWLVEPGVAVTVLTVPEFGESLLPTALSVRAESSGSSG